MRSLPGWQTFLKNKQYEYENRPLLPNDYTEVLRQRCLYMYVLVHKQCSNIKTYILNMLIYV